MANADSSPHHILAYRDLIKQTVREVVQQSLADRADVQALLVQELQRLQEGVLARYGLRPS